MTRSQTSPPSKLVKKSNAIARARWSARNILEPRLVALLASKVRIDDNDFKEYSVSISELITDRAAGGRDIKEVETSVNNLMSSVISIEDDDGWIKYTIFSKCRFHRKKGIIDISFHPDLRAHFLNLKSHFVTYSLVEFMTLPSIYSQRMFEFLKSWEDKKEITIDIKDLYEMLSVPDSLKGNFKDFRRRVLEKSHSDIETMTALRYQWEAIKKSRSVSSIRFVFGRRMISSIKNKKHEKTEMKNGLQQQKDVAIFRRCIERYSINCLGGNQPKRICDLCKSFR